MDKSKVIRGTATGIKLVISTIGGHCVGEVVAGIGKRMLPMPSKKLDIVTYTIGTGLISAAITSVTTNELCDTIDTWADILDPQVDKSWFDELDEAGKGACLDNVLKELEEMKDE